MAWDTNQPADTTKIRDLGVVIRANNTAIAGGDTSLAPPRWNIANTGGTPPATASMVRIYGDNDSAGNAQIFSIDPSSNKSRLTSTPIASSQAPVTVTISGNTATLSYSNSYKIFSQGHFTVTGTSYPLFEIIGYIEVTASSIVNAGTITIPWPFAFQTNFPISIQLTEQNGQNSTLVKLQSYSPTNFTIRANAGSLGVNSKIFLRVMGV